MTYAKYTYSADSDTKVDEPDMATTRERTWRRGGEYMACRVHGRGAGYMGGVQGTWWCTCHGHGTWRAGYMATRSLTALVIDTASVSIASFKTLEFSDFLGMDFNTDARLGYISTCLS